MMRYLYYTIQTLRRGRTSSFIKLLSLTLGLLVGVLLFAQIAYELNYEKCYPESERLVMVRCAIYDEDTGARKDTDVGEGGYDRTVFDVTAPTLAEEMSQWVESATTVSDFGGQAVYLDNKLLADTRYLLADTAFFQTLGIEVLEGNPRDMLRQNTVFLSQRFAKEAFGDESPIGRELTLNKQDCLTVRGIYRDMPDNTFLGHYDFVRSIHAGGGYVYGNGWQGNDIFWAILRLRHAEDADAVNAGIHCLHRGGQGLAHCQRESGEEHQERMTRSGVGYKKGEVFIDSSPFLYRCRSGQLSADVVAECEVDDGLAAHLAFLNFHFALACQPSDGGVQVAVGQAGGGLHFRVFPLAMFAC